MAKHIPDEFLFRPVDPRSIAGILRVDPFPPGAIWDIACGAGETTKLLGELGYGTYGTDERPAPGVGGRNSNFLLQPGALANTIIANPIPEAIERFVYHAQKLDVAHIYMFARVLALAGLGRSKAYESTHLQSVWIYRTRVSPDRKEKWEGGMIDFAWYVWHVGYKGAPEIGWI